jgi:hypothetical protein
MSCRISAAFVVVPGATALLCTSASLAAPPLAEVSLSLDGSKPSVLLALGLELPGGLAVYTGLSSDLLGKWTVTWNLTADLNPDGNAYVSGAVTAENKSSNTQDFDINVEWPLNPVISTGSVIGGSLLLKLKTDSNGGELFCNSRGEAVWQGMLGGQPVQSLFYCPFTMSATGAATLTTTADFGVPIPSAPGPQTAETIGVSVHSQITSGDKLTVTSLFVVKPGRPTRPERPESCIADINNDGKVSAADLGLMLAFWGTDGANEDGFLIDINNDGSVDAGDLGLMLGYWGACEEELAGE